MAEQDYIRHGGLPWKASEEQVPDVLEGGGKLISKDEATTGSKAVEDLVKVDQNWGVAGQLGLGLASGLSLGLAPGMMGLDPGMVQAAQTSPWYTAGDIGGTVLPALLSGGTSLEGRGALSAAMRMTPAGILDTVGTGTERLVAGILGNEVGVMGRLAQAPLKMAARGAVEGAAINIGHTVGDNLIQNKPFAAEALLASGVDGALFGGLIGGTLGTVGSLGSMAVESASGAITGQLGKRSGLWAKKLGQSAQQVEARVAEYGSTEAWAKGVNEVLEKGKTGAKIGSSDERLLEGFRAGKTELAAERMGVVQELDKSAAHIAPSVERLVGRLDTEVLAPRIGSYAEQDVTALVNSVKEKFQSLSPMQELTPVKVPDKKIPGGVKLVDEVDHLGNPKVVRKEFGPSVEPGYEIMGGKFPSGQKPTWEKWVTSRDQLAKELTDILEKTPDANPMRVGRQELKREILNIVDSEMASAMQEASKLSGLEGIAEKYAGASVGVRLAEQMEESMGKKAANKLLATSPTITPNELAYAGLMAANGNPAAAIAFAAGKGIVKKVVERLEPAMAQAAFDMSIGAKAARASTEVKSKAAGAIKRFFTTVAKTPAKAGYVSNASKSRAKGPVMDRKAYEELATRTEQLLSANHQDKVRRYNEALHAMGYTDLAMALMSTNNRAVQYLLYNQPARQGTKNMDSLRLKPASKVPTLQEYKYFRQARGVLGGPLALLEDLENGTLSRDQVMAMKYVYPEVHNEIVFNVAQEIAGMKARGEHAPMGKITQLGILLDAPVDSTQTPEYIGAVQTALNAPSPMEEPPEMDSPQAMAMGVSAQDMMTVTQKLASPG